MAAVGPRQAKILDRLAGGPHSIAALIARVDPFQPKEVLASLRLLAQRHVIEVRGEFDPLAGTMVALAPLPTDNADPRP